MTIGDDTAVDAKAFIKPMCMDKGQWMVHDACVLAYRRSLSTLHSHHLPSPHLSTACLSLHPHHPLLPFTHTLTTHTHAPTHTPAGRLVLSPIRLGAFCSVCRMTTIAAGAVVPNNTHLGPLSSSHELHTAHLSNKKFCSARAPAPKWCVRV